MPRDYATATCQNVMVDTRALVYTNIILYLRLLHITYYYIVSAAHTLYWTGPVSWPHDGYASSTGSFTFGSDCAHIRVQRYVRANKVDSPLSSSGIPVVLLKPNRIKSRDGRRTLAIRRYVIMLRCTYALHFVPRRAYTCAMTSKMIEL